MLFIYKVNNLVILHFKSLISYYVYKIILLG